MLPTFATITFGPFASDYHNAAVNAEFRDSLSDYLAAELLPQVDEPFKSTAGSLRAAYDSQKYCGPNSAVRDIYTLEFEFRRPSGSDSIKIDLSFHPKERSFSPRYRGKQLYLWTTARQKAHACRKISIQEVCDRILRGEVSTASCPCCGAELRIVNLPALFDVSCPTRCFNYNFHRDAESVAGVSPLDFRIHPTSIERRMVLGSRSLSRIVSKL